MTKRQSIGQICANSSRLKVEEKDSSPEKRRNLDVLLENLLGLLETYLRIMRLELKAGITHALALLLVIAAMLSALGAMIVFVSVGVALLLNDWLILPVYAGFFIVAGFYLLLTFVIIKSKMFFRDVIENIIDNLNR